MALAKHSPYMKERMRLLTEKVSPETNSSCTVTRPFLKMSGIPPGGDERPRLDAASLPDELQRLWDTMLRLDPDWDMFEWLTERAKEELKIIDANLVREKMRLEQRIARLEALANRIGRDVELDEGGLDSAICLMCLDLHENPSNPLTSTKMLGTLILHRHICNICPMTSGTILFSLFAPKPFCFTLK